jgi:hypothetical protein
VSNIACIPSTTLKFDEIIEKPSKKIFKDSQSNLFSPVKHYTAVQLMKMAPQAKRQPNHDSGVSGRIQSVYAT